MSWKLAICLRLMSILSSWEHMQARTHTHHWMQYTAMCDSHQSVNKFPTIQWSTQTHTPLEL